MCVLSRSLALSRLCLCSSRARRIIGLGPKGDDGLYAWATVSESSLESLVAQEGGDCLGLLKAQMRRQQLEQGERLVVRDRHCSF